MFVCSRRQFFKNAALTGTMFCLPGLQVSTAGARFLLARNENLPKPVSALHYKKLDHKKVGCELCPRKCKVADLERGYCGVRENQAGDYYTLVHSNPCSLNIDPIEKKPFFHFHPGTQALSLATAGCNMNCKFCQNWQISQVRPEQLSSYDAPPATLVKMAKERSCKSIAFTYSEPVIFYEYVFDTAKLTKNTSINSIVVSNGYICEKPMKELCQYINAMKVDLKSYTDSFYKDICSAELKPVLDTLKILVSQKIWTEIVYLVIPTLNDDLANIKDMCLWILDNLGPDVPVHFSRFYPTYQLRNIPPTPISSLTKIWEIAKKTGINFVYIGNVPGHDAENTYCPKCNRVIVNRRGYRIDNIGIEDNRCKFCKTKIPGVWS